MTPSDTLTVRPFLQEVPSIFENLTGCRIRAAAADASGRVWLGSDAGLFCLENSAWRSFSVSDGLPHASIEHLLFADASLWVATEGGLCRCDGQAFKPVPAVQGRVKAITAAGGLLSVVTGDSLYRRRSGAWEMASDGTPELHSLAAGPKGSLWGASRNSLHRWDGGAWESFSIGEHDIRCLAADGAGHLWAGTSEGLTICANGKALARVTGADGLPYDDIRCMAFGLEGELWLGTGIGCARWQGGEWRYYQGRRYLPDDEITALTVSPGGSVWIGTAGGAARIAFQPFRLEDKARHFERLTQTYHLRQGYIACGISFDNPEDPARYVQEAADNDGLWTALYTAAQSFRWAATHDQEALDMARFTCRALRFLEEVTDISGFPARAVVTPEEIAGPHPPTQPSGGEWHPSSDGKWLWKGDTSSDELDGHFLAYSVYYDLAADISEKEAVRETVRKIMDYILENDCLLLDRDGLHTTWGVWGPKYLNDDPEWWQERGLNSLEILSYLKTALHITGDPKYGEAACDLIENHGYALNTLYQKITGVRLVNHSDDELAFLSYYPLLRYETDPGLRAIYLASLERSWRIERPERSPLWNFIYGACTGKPCDAESAALTLREIPLSTRNWASRNSRRKDIRMDEEAGRFGEMQSLAVLPYRERHFTRWNENPYRLDTGGDGRTQDDGTFYLLPYWMGRYHGLIAEG